MTNLQKLRLYGSGIALVLAMMLFIPAIALAQSPPPRPPVATGGGSAQPELEDESEPDEIWGSIYGNVTDLSTGKPAAGVTVLINKMLVRTDTIGDFSITGLVDGAYTLELTLPFDFVLARPTQTVTITNKSRIDVELDYYGALSPREFELLNPQASVVSDESAVQAEPATVLAAEEPGAVSAQAASQSQENMSLEPEALARVATGTAVEPSPELFLPQTGTVSFWNYLNRGEIVGVLILLVSLLLWGFRQKIDDILSTL